MGTPEGFRQRKYHGFFSAVPGRSECAYLLDLEIECNGRLLWPHAYAGPEGQVIYPELTPRMIHEPRQRGRPITVKFEETPDPSWTWKLPEGELRFNISAGQSGGICLNWRWQAKRAHSHLQGHEGEYARVGIRPLFGMRNLHGMGGKEWAWEPLNLKDRAKVGNVHCFLEGGLTFESDPIWYRSFFYAEEARRGYDSKEDLYSAGVLRAQLNSGDSCALWLSEDSEIPLQPAVHSGKRRIGALDFVVTQPAGVIAGFPWFGEWGRDTFISLTGIAYAWVRTGGDPTEVWAWASEVLERWARWIETEGQIPNLIGRNGEPQWEAADATLWWCHALASLWHLSLAPFPSGIHFPAESIEKKFGRSLSLAITAIREGRHGHLRLNDEGLLDVLTPHSTWMDACVAGRPVTPRTGPLPEINALWFQAQLLDHLWSGSDRSDLQDLARRTLECREPDRPNMIFLHSIPLAPSFVLKDAERLKTDLEYVAGNFWTPVGLRTLRPGHPDFKPHCVGTQEERDRSYHQGASWGWLGGHFEMAVLRSGLELGGTQKMLSPEVLESMPIQGHVAEIFDADLPFAARGAPAQAWSIACLEEAMARKRLKIDSKLAQLLSQKFRRRKLPPVRKRERGGEIRRDWS